MKTSIVLTAAAIAVALTAVADGQVINVVKMRKAIMETKSAASAISVDMIRGKYPYDAVIAATAAISISHDNELFPTLFPDASKPDVFKPPLKDDLTKAKPNVWTDNAAFKALSAKMVKDAQAAADAAP